MSCVFCKIVTGEMPSAKVYEDEKVLAFLDISPVNKGHTLIIPKDHHHMITDTPDDLVEYIFVKAKNISHGIKKAFKADYVALSVVGIDVPHFHVHLVPRFDDDGLANWWPTQEYGEGEMDEYAEKLRAEV